MLNKPLKNNHKKIILDLGSGIISEGFPSITAEVKNNGVTQVNLKGELPANEELHNAYISWNLAYQNYVLCTSNTFLSSNDAPEVYDTETNYSEDYFDSLVQELNKSSQNLNNLFLEWLESKEFEKKFCKKLWSYIDHNDFVLLIIITDNEFVRSLPWHLWDFFDNYEKSEVAFSLPEYEYIGQSQTPINTVRILAVFGDESGLDFTQEKELLENLRSKKNAELVILPDNKNKKLSIDDLNEALRDTKGWDIFFFSGHSDTDDGQGKMRLSPESICTIDSLNQSFKDAISKGLHLAIFNSCRGGGLANQLQNLSIPEVIVMNHYVENKVACEFFKEFITNFSTGNPSHLSVRLSRDKLRKVYEKKDILKNSFLLPTIYQNPTFNPPTWNELKNHGTGGWKIIGGTTIVVSTLVILIRALGLLQGFELANYDFMMRSRHLVRPLLGLPKYEKVDDRILLVIGDEKSSGLMGDQEIVEAIERINSYKPVVIGIDIAQDIPNPPNNNFYTKLIELYRTNNHLIGVCSYADSIAPPPILKDNNPSNQLALVDIPLQAKDDVVRTIALGYELTDICNTRDYLGTLLANRYLENKQGEDIDLLSLEVPLFSGLFGRRDNTGLQIMFNYRHYNAENNRQPFNILSIDELLNLEENKLKQKITDNIIIIGKRQHPSNTDIYETPYENDVLGIYLVAHSTSQIISYVSDKKKLLRLLNFWEELPLVILSSLVGAIIGWKIRNNIMLLVVIIFVILFILYLSIWILLLEGLVIGFIPLSISFGLSSFLSLIVQNKSRFIS